MNAVEIEQAITDLAEQPFDPAEFPYAFLEAFGNKATTIKRLLAGASNKSDLGGVLQTSNVHILTCHAGQVTTMLKALKDSPATTKGKAKFVLATDGTAFEAEDLSSGETPRAWLKFPASSGKNWSPTPSFTATTSSPLRYVCWSLRIASRSSAPATCLTT